MRGRLPKKLGEFLLFINIRQVEYKNRSRRIIGWFMLNF